MKPTEAMYNAGLKYLLNRGTTWCVNDLFIAMWEACQIPDIVLELTNFIEAYHFKCEGGYLENCTEWIKLKEILEKVK